MEQSFTAQNASLDAASSARTANDVRRIFAETFKLAPEAVSPDMSPETIDAWDSFGHMRLITALETQLSIRLTMEQILAIDSFASLCRTLEEARAA